VVDEYPVVVCVGYEESPCCPIDRNPMGHVEPAEGEVWRLTRRDTYGKKEHHHHNHLHRGSDAHLLVSLLLPRTFVSFFLSCGCCCLFGGWRITFRVFGDSKNADTSDQKWNLTPSLKAKSMTHLEIGIYRFQTGVVATTVGGSEPKKV